MNPKHISVLEAQLKKSSSSSDDLTGGLCNDPEHMATVINTAPSKTPSAKTPAGHCRQSSSNDVSDDAMSDE